MLLREPPLSQVVQGQGRHGILHHSRPLSCLRLIHGAEEVAAVVSLHNDALRVCLAALDDLVAPCPVGLPNELKITAGHIQAAAVATAVKECSPGREREWWWWKHVFVCMYALACVCVGGGGGVEKEEEEGG